MCGVAAIVGTDAVESDRLPGMVDALEHRGPDARGLKAVDGCSLTVVGFALFWLDGYSAGACTGSSCLIQGRFVSSELTVNAVAGVFDPNSLIHFTRLSE